MYTITDPISAGQNFNMPAVDVGNIEPALLGSKRVFPIDLTSAA